MKLKIANLACKVLTLNSNFCKEIGMFGTLSIPENDPIFKEQQKDAFDKWLVKKGLNPVIFWKKFEEYLNSNSCREEYNFIYNPALAPWEQIWIEK
jgi:hypothetical protein